MTNLDKGPGPIATGAHSGLIARVKNILLRPGAEWQVINLEPATIKGLYMGYALILAAIPPLSTLIGQQIFGVGFGFGGFGISTRPAIGPAIVGALLMYGLSLAMVAVMAYVVNALAPTFRSEKNLVRAFQLVVYGYTASWVAGIFGLIPALAVLSIVGLYSIYVIYKGLPVMMRTPQDQVIPYMAVTALIAIVASVIGGMIVAAVIVPMTLLSGGYAANTNNTTTFSTPSGSMSVNVAALEAQAKQMEAAAKQMEAQAAVAAAGGTVVANGAPAEIVPASDLQALLPGQLGALPRTELSSGSGGVAGIGGAAAEADYSAGDARVSLTVADMGAMGAIAGMGGILGVNANTQTSTGYEKVSTINGRMTTEKYDRTSKVGSYGQIVAGRFMVQAEGTNVDMGVLKAAVNGVNAGRLEQLTRTANAG